MEGVDWSVAEEKIDLAWRRLIRVTPPTILTPPPIHDRPTESAADAKRPGRWGGVGWCLEHGP